MEELEGLSALLSSLGGQHQKSFGQCDNHRNQSSEAHLAFIPNQLNDNTITLTGTTLNRQEMKTVFIGITTSRYTPSMWDDDAKKWINYFRLLEQNCIHVKMQELLDWAGKIDCARALVEINRALVILNTVPNGDSVRIICLGPGVSQLTLDALTYLIREWKTPANTPREVSDKKLQVVTTGDSKVFSIFGLCQKLCTAGVCQSIEFYNTMSYYPFGHYRKSYFFKV